jgi:hypothetical protein
MPVNRFDRTAYADSTSDSSDEPAPEGGPEAVRRLQAQLAELADYARFYASAKKDAILAGVRKVALLGLAGLAAFVVFCTMLVTAAVLALLGLAQLIGETLGDRLWAGYLIVGLGLLIGVAIGLLTAIIFLQRRFRTQTVNKYAKRRQSQSARFGHDLGQQAGGEAERN